jgi:uncharacterized protein
MTAAALAVLLAVVGEAPVPPPPARWVDDGAGFLSPATREALDRKLEAYERATGHQVVVWIGRSIGATPLEDWAVRTFERWKVGRKGIDDGLAVFILVDDRAIDIEVGYGLEDEVPDVVAARIIREVMAPRLRAGDRDGAVTAGVDAILASIEGGPWTGDGGEGEGRPTSTEIVLGVMALILFAIVVIKYPRLAMMILWTIVTFGRSGGGRRAGGFRGGGGRSGGGGGRGRW